MALRIVDRTEVERSFAIIDMIRAMPDLVGFAAIRQMPSGAREDLYEFLKQVEDERCG